MTHSDSSQKGLPPSFKEKVYASQRGGNKKGGSGGANDWLILSLSSLTFTHQFARTLLIEQIYRASEIRKGMD